MESKIEDVLAEFRRRRKLFDKLSSEDAKMRFAGLNEWFRSVDVIGKLIRDVNSIPSYQSLIDKMRTGEPPEAKTPDEIAAVALYIIERCGSASEVFTTFCSRAGIKRPGREGRAGRASNQGYVDSVMRRYIEPAFEFIEHKLEEVMGERNLNAKVPLEKRIEELAKSPGQLEREGGQAGSAYGEGKYGEGAYGGDEKNVDDIYPVRQYHQEVMRFLGAEKDYPNGSVFARGGRLDSGEYSSDIELKDAESKQELGVIEVNATKEGELYVREKSELIEKAERLGVRLYVLGPAVSDPSAGYEVLRLTEEGNLEQISMEDFPDYEDLRKKVGTKRQFSGGDDESEGKFRKDEIRCIRIIAEWFRENKSLVNRDEAMKEFGVDNDRYDVLMKMMEHYGVVEKVESAMGKNGYAIVFWPSAYAEELAREFDRGGGEKDDTIFDQMARNALDRQRHLLDGFKALLVEEKGVPEDCLSVERVRVDVGRQINLDLLLIRDGGKTLAVIGYYYGIDAGHIERERKLLLRYKEEIKLNDCPLYIACLAPEHGKRFVDIYEVSDREKPSPLSFVDFPDFEDLRKQSEGDAGIEYPKGLESPVRIADVHGNVPTIQVEGIGEKDRLGRDTLVKTLGGMFAQTECDNGFTMALLGDWGQGKSTVMGLLQAELEEKHKDKFEFAKYNAWEYEKADNVAAGIAQEVVAGLLDISEWKMPFLRARFAWREHKSSVYVFILSLVAAVAFSLVMMVSLPLIELVESVSDKFPNAKSLIELVATYWPWILPMLGLRNILKKTEHPLKVGLRTYFRLPDYGKHLGLVPVLKKDITALCQLQLNECVIPLIKVRVREIKKLIVFVDDLDRCNVDHIVKVLDAIRLVMTIPNVIVMIGIDHRIAFKAIAKHYKELADGGDTRGAGEIARDYLGKIIQLPLRLRVASHGELKDYVFEKLFDKRNIVDDTKPAEPPTPTGPVERPPEEVADGPKEPGSPGETPPPKPGGTGEEGPEVIDDDAELETTASDEEIGEAIKDKASERSAFYELVGKFGFGNPRQLLRLHNSFRFLKGYGRGKGEGHDTIDIVKMLFWQEFLHNWPVEVRRSCMAALIDEGHDEGVKPMVKRVLDNVVADIRPLFDGEDYAELAEFVRIVVLPHNEEGVFDTKEEIEEWLKEMKEKKVVKKKTKKRSSKEKVE